MSLAPSPASVKPSASSRLAGEKNSSLVERLIRAGCRPVSPASLAAFRIAFGLIGLIAVVRFVANGWVDDVYILPAYHFTYAGFGWMQPWPAWGMYLHFALLGLASLCVMLGYRYQLSIIAFFLLFTYVELIDQTTYLNHYYLVSLLSLIMVFLPMASVASLDSVCRGNRGGDGGGDSPSGRVVGTTVPVAALWALRVQLALVYVFAGVAKLNPDWLLHAQPLTIWLYNSADTPFIGAFVREQWLAYALSWAGVFFDLTIVGWLLRRRTRPYAFAALVVFHVSTAVLFPAIGMFPWIMIGATLVFFDPDWPVTLMRRLRGASAPTATTSPSHANTSGAMSPSWPVRAAFLLAVVFLAVQVLLPLRHLAYPGNVRWTDEGYRFAWRVLVTEKTGLVRFRVTNSYTGGELLVYPEDYLTPTQVERIAYQPGLVLATAHIIRDDFAQRGHLGTEVHADVYVSYNGRPAARLLDPRVDLASVDGGIGPKHWVLPPPT